MRYLPFGVLSQVVSPLRFEGPTAVGTVALRLTFSPGSVDAKSRSTTKWDGAARGAMDNPHEIEASAVDGQVSMMMTPSVSRLTPRQIDCLVLAGQHLTSKEIAAQLGISVHTVDQRMRVAMRKLRVTRRRDAVRLVCECRPFFRPPDLVGLLVETRIQGAVETDRDSLPLPFATAQRPYNAMSIALRLFWIVAIGFGAAFSMGLYLAGLESLGRFLSRY